MRIYFVSAALASTAICLAQTAASVSLSNGVQLRITATLGQPTGAQVLKIELARASGNSFYRVFRDQNDMAVFAYELAVDRSADGDEFRLTTKPAGVEFESRFPRADGGKPTPTVSANHELKALRSNESAQIGLFELAGVGTSVIDRVQVSLNRGGTETKEQRAAGGFRLAGMKVSVNRAPLPVAVAGGLVSGKYAMLYIPGRGGYFFSTDQPAGRAFVKAGSIDGNKMRFTVDNENFECSADGPIFPGSTGGELWVFHNRAYKPSGNWTRDLPTQPQGDQFFAAASDSLNWWF